MFKNWKTTILGLGIAIFTLMQGGMGWKNATLAALMAAAGAYQKDHNVTGGS